MKDLDIIAITVSQNQKWVQEVAAISLAKRIHSPKGLTRGHWCNNGQLHISAMKLVSLTKL
jgi:hypothetical protein